MYTFYESVRSKECGRTSTNMYLQYKWDMENLANHRYKVKTGNSFLSLSFFLGGGGHDVTEVQIKLSMHLLDSFNK